MALLQLPHKLNYALLRLQQKFVCGRRAEIRPKDFFGKTLQGIIRKYKPKRILEIGSWDGSGSTACLLSKMDYQPDFLDCVEAMPEKAAKLQKLIVPRFPFVHVHVGPSISYDDWSFKDFEKDFWLKLTPEQQRRFNRDEFHALWQREEKLLRETTAPSYFSTTRRDGYDLVVLDGGEFAAVDEYRLLNKRFKAIALDDVFGAFKCLWAYEDLLKDNSFELIAASRFVRRGFAAFLRKE